MTAARFSRKGVRLELWQGWRQGTSSGGTFQCHWQEAEDKIVLLSEANGSSVFVNTRVSHYMYSTWVHSYTRTHIGGHVCVCVKLRILWSLVHPYNGIFCICPRPGCVSSSHCSCKYSSTLLCSRLCAGVCVPGTPQGLSCFRDSSN